MKKKEFFTSSAAEETITLGEDFGKTLLPDDMICFFGDLGAGKTTFIRGLVAGAAGCSHEEVTSPTFVYLNIYEGKIVVYHFDLYRLQRPADFCGMGFDEFLEGGGICCIEWSERIAALLPDRCIHVNMTHRGENKRHIAITYLAPS
ncbi:MAG: tRNA (adenosine(37)-N6)-threonylcarbamoyltransferase complex ATPase subunit type 1 TsaE [Waddliaceae bacterium]